MTKSIRLLLIGLIGLSTIQAQVKLGGEIGIHNSGVIEKNNIPGWDTSAKKYYSTKTGIHVGILLEIPVGGRFYFQPGLNYTSKGRQYAKNYDSSSVFPDTVYVKNKLQLGYMEIPPYITYKIPLSSNHKNNFLIGAGPYFAFILNSKLNYQSLLQVNDSTPNYTNQTKDLLVGNAVDKYKTFDYGVNIKAGFEFGNVMLSGYFSRGLSNFYTAEYAGTFHHQVMGATLGIWLGKTTAPAPVAVKDTDKDGIPDDQDMCPLQPGVAKYNGCPVPDTDHDGIDDEHDSCKTIAGVARYNGCPVPDTDGDGIDDEHDSCKTIPGVAKYNGCPVPDRDHDGVNDDEDNCPDIPGTAENHGCPEIKKEIREEVNYVAQNILFATSSDSLTAGSYISLDQLVDILRNHNELQLTVEGHTDNVGKAEHNMLLSQHRAMAVKTYLVKKGIPEKRIITIGYGMDRPKADNNTAAGRSVNRRVELKLTTP